MKHHIANKTDCSTCWARPLCAGGCYHEAHTRYGSSGGRTCITASGFAAGRTRVSRSTARSRATAGIPGAVRRLTRDAETHVRHLTPINKKARHIAETRRSRTWWRSRAGR